MLTLRSLVVTVLLPLSLLAQPSPGPETARWTRQAAAVTILRDDYGLAHIYGRTDADAVFGMIYAQAEDDFNRIEVNYLNSLGRLAEAEGESKIYQDLRMKLFIQPPALKAQYTASPSAMKVLMTAWADGLNYYLATHPNTHPRVITRFEPWMALSFTEGSIGGDIERINLKNLESFYGKIPIAQTISPAQNNDPYAEPSGSNGIAIAPPNTQAKHALLLINPHTTFFFRSELQMVSNEGLNTYGAVTWGQFFIYQGFSDKAGWMHTSSGVDAVDEYLETIYRKDGRIFYKYGNQNRPMESSEITVPYRTPTGLAEKKFTVYRTVHGPVIREQDGKWVAIKLMQEPIKALQQSYLRTKARNYSEFRKTMEFKANSSNNTVFADAEGNIAYFHGNYIPRRDPKFDFTKPVDGSNPATDWKGLHTVDECPQLLNPHSGWLYNVNNWPWSAAGPDSQKREAFPAYVEMGKSETPRGLHALRILENTHGFTLESLIASAYDSYLPYFETRLPALFKAWDDAPVFSPLKARVADQIKVLRAWDLRWSADSTATSLAVFWGVEMRTKSDQPLEALAAATDKLQADFGTWKKPWGEINRFQRLTADLNQPFDDQAPSIPVPFTSAEWGSLASFGAKPYPATKKWYGTSGNSFVAAVEFGAKVRAKAVTAGGESGDPASKHFNDQAQRYATGALRDVYYYRDQLTGHTEREYHPGPAK